jgi:DNA polymerase-3 subunit delta
MDFETILQDLAKKIYHPVYLLHGEEPYFIDRISDYIEKNALTEEEKSFNQTIFYGKDSDARVIADTAYRYPMMSERQVVIVKEAQSLKTIDNLYTYVSRPMSSTILVINYKYKTLDKRTRLYKAIKANGAELTANKLYENQIPAWIENYLKKSNYTIAPQASQILTAYLGTELSKISNELNKLLIAVKDTTHLTPVHIEKNIGLSKDFNMLELQDALGSKNIFKANQIIKYFGANPRLHPIQVITSTLFGFYSKMLAIHFMKDRSEKGALQEIGGHPFYLKKLLAASKNYSTAKLFEIISILREYDLKSKGLGVSTMVDPAELQKEMIYKILH